MSKHKLGELLGEGSFGKVYRVKNTGKVIKYIHLPPDGFHNYIEPYILLNLNNQYVMNADEIILSSVGLLKIVQDEGIDMSKIEKKTLRNERIEIYNQIKDGLTYLHSNNILHGDLKPANIIKINSTYKINDFSFAMFLKSDPQKVERTIYTSGYRAPEVNQNLVSLRSDIWAFGKTMQTILFERDQKKMDLGSCLKLNYRDRDSFIDLKNQKFISDTEICIYNDNLPFKNNRHRKIFCQKIRNTGKILNCSQEYKNIEDVLVSKKFDIRINQN